MTLSISVSWNSAEESVALQIKDSWVSHLKESGNIVRLLMDRKKQEDGQQAWRKKKQEEEVCSEELRRSGSGPKSGGSILKQYVLYKCWHLIEVSFMM